MEINLNNSAEFTLENVRKLIASGDDSVHTQFRVSNQGMLFLSKDVGNQNLIGIKFRLETNSSYGGHVGEEAAINSDWVKRIYEAVKKNWPNPISSYIEFF